jgi:hypothetical protein
MNMSAYFFFLTTPKEHKPSLRVFLEMFTYVPLYVGVFASSSATSQHIRIVTVSTANSLNQFGIKSYNSPSFS